MKGIKLTQNKIALVDDEDYKLVSERKWFFEHGYARSDYKRKRLYMHRFILGIEGKEVIDHKNGDGLDNRRDNLRVCTRSQNRRNSKPNKNTSSVYKGVFKSRNKWNASITVKYKIIRLGTFKSEIEAAVAYDKAAINFFGEFAYKNFKDS